MPRSFLSCSILILLAGAVRIAVSPFSQPNTLTDPKYADASSERGKKLRETIAEKLKLDSLEYQTLEGLIEAIGLDRDEICTYCWDGRE